MSEKEINKIVADNYLLKVYIAYDHNEDSPKAASEIIVSLNNLYRYFEPGFFQGDFYVIKHFKDTLVLDEEKGIPIYHDKNILLNKTSGTLIIQIFSDGKLILWENENPASIINKTDSLVYHFHKNKERFIANQTEIDITSCPFGSRYATQFIDLVAALNTYSANKIYQSSCPHFAQSWFDTNRLFFKGGGSGSNIPEKYIQQSVHEFLGTFFSRGITIDAIREYNVGGGDPKPVDVKIHWKEANRAALIEIKFLGTVKGLTGKITTDHSNPKANAGYVQLKGYHDKAIGDLPTTIIKSFLIVIDGRRNNLTENMTTISYADGMYYKDISLQIDNGKKFHESIPAFEKPIKMFAAPICI